MAEPLRYLDIAQHEPWIINTENVLALKGLNLNIQIPNTKVMQELKSRGINGINEDDVIATFQDFFKLLKN